MAVESFGQMIAKEYNVCGGCFRIPVALEDYPNGYCDCQSQFINDILLEIISDPDYDGTLFDDDEDDSEE